MSLIGVFAGKTRVVVCADSRCSAPDGTASDNVQKLFQFGRETAVGVVGIVNLSRKYRDYLPGRVEALSGIKRLADQPAAIMDELAADLWPRVSSAVERDPDNFRWLLSHPGAETVLTAFALRRQADGGGITLYESKFPLGTDAAGNPIVHPPQRTEFLRDSVPSGRFTYLLAEDNRKPPFIDTDAPDDAVLARIDLLFQYAESPQTGGRIAVVALEQTGVRWLRRKLNTGNRKFFGVF